MRNKSFGLKKGRLLNEEALYRACGMPWQPRTSLTLSETIEWAWCVPPSAVMAQGFTRPAWCSEREPNGSTCGSASLIRCATPFWIRWTAYYRIALTFRSRRGAKHEPTGGPRSRSSGEAGNREYSIVCRTAARATKSSATWRFPPHGCWQCSNRTTLARLLVLRRSRRNLDAEGIAAEISPDSSTIGLPLPERRVGNSCAQAWQ
jgi:hypothetical protein